MQQAKPNEVGLTEDATISNSFHSLHEVKYMEKFELGEVQERFAGIIWENEPVKSGDLVRLCREKLEWNKSTTYTVLRKLCEKGIFKNEDGTVYAVISRERFYSSRSRQFVEENFKGSLPAFIAAFVSGKSLSDEEAEEIRRIIEEYKGEK